MNPKPTEPLQSNPQALPEGAHLIAKMKKEMKIIDKEPMKQQSTSKESDKTKHLDDKNKLGTDLENASQREASQANETEALVKKTPIEETLKKIQSTFQSDWYPNADDRRIKLIQALENYASEPVSDISLDDIIDIGESIKTNLKEAVILPFLYPRFFEKGLISFPSRILLVGPHPRKMQILQAMAHESKAKLFVFPTLDLFCRWREDCERIIKIIFEIGCYYSPSIIYIEDIEEIGFTQWYDGEWKRRIKTEFLIQCQRFQSFEVENEKTKTKEWKPFIVIGGSECPWNLDQVMLRRFNKRLCLNLLNKDDRRHFIQRHFQDSKALFAEDLNWGYITKRTEYYSPDDLASVCKEAIMASRRIEIKKTEQSQDEIGKAEKSAIEENIVTQSHFVEALRRIHCSIWVDDPELALYKTWTEEHMSESL